MSRTAAAGHRRARRLPPPARGGPRRDGRRLRGRADLAAAAGRAEGPAVRRGHRPPPPPAVQERGAGGRARAAREDRAGARGRLRARRPLLRDAVHRGAEPRRADRRAPPPPRRARIAAVPAARSGRSAGRPIPDGHPAMRSRRRGHARRDDHLSRTVLGPSPVFRPGGRAGPAGGAGAGARPPGGHRPSRRQAGQPAAGPPRAALGHRLRPGPGHRRCRADDHRRAPGHAPLRQPRAGPGPARDRRPPQRRLFAGRDALRAADAAPALRGPRPQRADPADRRRRSRPPRVLDPSDPRRAGDDRPEGAPQGAGRPLRDGAGAGRRPAALPRRPADPGPPADAGRAAADLVAAAPVDRRGRRAWR